MQRVSIHLRSPLRQAPRPCASSAIGSRSRAARWPRNQTLIEVKIIAWPRSLAPREISAGAPQRIVSMALSHRLPLSGALKHLRQKAALARGHFACEMASGKIARAARKQQWVFGGAWVEGEGASGAEAAARRNVNGVRRLALQQIGLGLVGLLFDDGNRAEQRSRIGVSRN